MNITDQAFNARLTGPHKHWIQADITPSSGGADFGSLSICDVAGGNVYLLLTDDPELLRILARKASSLAARVETANKVHAARKEFSPVVDDSDVLATLTDTSEVGAAKSLPATDMQ